MITMLDRPLTPAEELLRSWQQAGREALSAAVTPSTLNSPERTVDCIWYSGADVQRFDWMTGEVYMRRFDPKGVDLSLLNNGAPVCDNHQIESASDQVGRVERAWREDGNYLGTLRFSKRPEVDGLWRDITDGIVSKFSMGVEILASEDLARKEGAPLVKLATSWRPFEISVCPIPADYGTTTLSREEIPPATDNDPAWMISARARMAEIEALRSDRIPLVYQPVEVHKCFALSAERQPMQCRECEVWTNTPHLQDMGKDERILCGLCCPCRGCK